MDKEGKTRAVGDPLGASLGTSLLPTANHSNTHPVSEDGVGTATLPSHAIWHVWQTPAPLP